MEKIIEFIAGLLYPTVDGAVAGVIRSVEKLERVATYHDNNVAKQEAIIRAAEQSADASSKEARRAFVVANKLRALVGE